MNVQADAPFEGAERILKGLDLGFEKWSSLSLTQRIRGVRNLRKIISKNARKIAEAISEECERPLMEALSQEVLPVLEMAKYCEKKFPRWLACRRLPYRRPGFWRKKNFLYYEPIGPVAVFSPQNFPFSLGMMTLIFAILPGNTVVLKPSEKSALIPTVIEDLLRDSGLLESCAAYVLKGDMQTGSRLIRHPSIKKIFFFGRKSSGKNVAETCVRQLKPFVLEMGGGSSAFVGADADIDQAAAGLAWSSFYTQGKSCVSTERIFVHERIYAEFISLFKQKVSNFQQDIIRDSKFEKNNHSEIFRLNELLEDAKAKGADIFQARVPYSSKNHAHFPFTVVFNPAYSMHVSREEIFGPVVIVQAVSNLEEATAEMNNHFPPLGVSIWSRDHRQAHHLARKVSAGMIWINDSSFGLPHLPWGGSDKSGWGRLFSEFSIHEITQQKWISHHPARFARARFWWNPYTPKKERLMMRIAENFF